MKPEMRTCCNQFCENYSKCRRASGVAGNGQASEKTRKIMADVGARCQAYYPSYYEKDTLMALKQEPLPDRKIAGKNWTMYLERIGKNIICHAFIDDPKVQHSYGCSGTRDEAVEGCVAQIERIYTKKAQ